MKFKLDKMSLFECYGGKNVFDVFGKRLHCKYWEPTGTPKGLVVIIHGYAEHVLCYEEVAKQLISKDLFVFGHDHIGHGLSCGDQVQIDSIDQYVDDIIKHVSLVKEAFPRLPLFAVAHSMGGMIAISTVLRDSNIFSGLFLVAPLIFCPKATPLLRAVVKLISWIAPNFIMGYSTSKEMTRDKIQRQRMRTDPLRWQGGCKSKWTAASLKAMKQNKKRFNSILLPFMIIHGDVDQICELRGSRMLYEKSPSTDKNLKVFPGALHNLYHEIAEVREEAFGDTVQWICQHIPNQNE